MPVRRPRPGWTILTLLCAGAALVFLRERRDPPVAEGLVSLPVEPAPPAVEPVPATPPRNEVSVSVSCPGDELSMTEHGRSRELCVNTVDIDQNGSVRSYRVALGESPLRLLRIDAVGSRVMAATLEGQASHEFLCRAPSCAGIRIGARDVRGARLIRMEGVTLMPQFSVGVAADGGVMLTGQVQTPPEDQLAGLACSDQGVTIVTSESSMTSFCPRGGAGFELASDGTRAYRFTNLDGESIRIAVDDAERVKRVEYQGEQTLVCSSPACTSVRVSQPGPSGERTFTFAGTTLTEVSKAESNAVMNGTLILPPL